MDRMDVEQALSHPRVKSFLEEIFKTTGHITGRAFKTIFSRAQTKPFIHLYMGGGKWSLSLTHGRVVHVDVSANQK